MSLAISSDDEIKKVIDTIEVKNIVDYLQNEYKFSKEEALQSFKQYKDYLFLLIKYKKMMPPSFEIHQALKAHLFSHIDEFVLIKKRLFNGNSYLIKYQDYFESKKFIKKENKDGYEEITKPLFLKEFNENLPDFEVVYFSRKWKRYVTPFLQNLMYIGFLIVASLIIYLLAHHLSIFVA